MNLVEELKKNGIKAQNYLRPPFGKDVFALTIRGDKKEGIITVHQGLARVTVHGGSKTHRQVTVTVLEGDRRITKPVSVKFFHDKPTVAAANNRLTREFPVGMPDGTVWSVKNLKIGEAVVTRSVGTHWPVSGKVTGHYKNKTVNHFLMGVDESHAFISPLPALAETVSQAHRLLRPKELKGKVAETPRQGEWYFIPITAEETKQLKELAVEHPGQIRVMNLGRGHVAKSATFLNGTTYAIGLIVDYRRGRHEPLFLKDWRQVVKNRETTIKVSKEQKNAKRSHTRTWD